MIMACAEPLSNVVTISDKVLPAYYLVNAMLTVAQSRGVDLHKLVRGTGIFAEHLTPDSVISAKQYRKLVANLQAHCRHGETSFLIGRMFCETWLPPQLNSALEQCGSLRRLSNAIVNLRWYCCPFVTFRQFDVENSIVFALEDTMGFKKQWPFTVEVALSFLVGLLKLLSTQRCDYQFFFSHERPKNVSDFETYLGYQVHFNAPLTCVAIPKASLSMTMDKDATLSCQTKAERPVTLLKPRLSILDKVRLAAQYEPSKTQVDIAHELGVSPATFKRKLKEHDYSFRTLQEESRRQQAIVLLAIQKLSNTQGADRMAFTDLPNFRRTIKRLTGYTPSELRGLLY